MPTFTKLMLLTIILLLMVGLLWGCYKIFFLGHYFANASFITSGFIIIGALAAIYLAVIAIQTILKNKNSL